MSIRRDDVSGLRRLGTYRALIFRVFLLYFWQREQNSDNFWSQSTANKKLRYRRGQGFQENSIDTTQPSLFLSDGCMSNLWNWTGILNSSVGFRHSVCGANFWVFSLFCLWKFLVSIESFVRFRVILRWSFFSLDERVCGVKVNRVLVSRACFSLKNESSREQLFLSK